MPLHDLQGRPTANVAEADEVWREVGRVGVDSGQLAIVDPCYLDEKIPPLGLVADAGGDGYFAVEALYVRERDYPVELRVKLRR